MKIDFAEWIFVIFLVNFLDFFSQFFGYGNLFKIMLLDWVVLSVIQVKSEENQKKIRIFQKI